MEIVQSDKLEPEVVQSDVQTSTVLKRSGLIGDIGSQVLTVNEALFRPGERTNWHTHDYGQTLYVTEGTGVVATKATRRTVSEGDIIFIPPDETHWHGTDPSNKRKFGHISIVVRDQQGEGTHLVEDLKLD